MALSRLCPYSFLDHAVTALAPPSGQIQLAQATPPITATSALALEPSPRAAFTSTPQPALEPTVISIKFPRYRHRDYAPSAGRQTLLSRLWLPTTDVWNLIGGLIERLRWRGGQIIPGEACKRRIVNGPNGRPSTDKPKHSVEDSQEDPSGADSDAFPNNSFNHEIPQYVLDYAPYIYLYSKEQFWPCDMVQHLIHTTPHLNFTPLQARSDHPNLTNLNELNRWGPYVYLKSDDNVEKRPEWLGGKSNIPAVEEGAGELFRRVEERMGEEEDGAQPTALAREELRQLVSSGQWKMQDTHRDVDRFLNDRGKASVKIPGHEQGKGSPGDSQLSSQYGKEGKGGRSQAPAVLVTIPKDNGVLDAFWFFFYSYNLGNSVLNVRFGNHVGDWEHMVVRFRHGEPESLWYSEHTFGRAYTYDAVEKIGKRPIGYSATGSHAMYATAGSHPYVLPWGLLHDNTDRGPLWDPALNALTYTYETQSGTLRPGNVTPGAPTAWFDFKGHWGDKTYPMSDRRQYKFAGQYHYTSGPLGPKFKSLGRREICPSYRPCVVRETLEGDGRPELWDGGDGEGEEEVGDEFLGQLWTDVPVYA